MKNITHFEPLSPLIYKDYIAIGTRAYNQHYQHLWPSKDTSPYILNSFTTSVLVKEQNDQNTMLYLIKNNTTTIGIFKFTIHCSLNNFTKEDALYVDKIYILKEFSGKGIGKKVLQFITLRAKELSKKIIWLDTMQKGLAINFYLKNNFKIYDQTKITLPTILETEKQMYIMVKKI